MALNWPMCQDRHPGIPQFAWKFTNKFAKLEGNVAWQAFREVARAWDGNEGIHIGQGIRFQTFSAYLGPWGVDSGPFSYFGGVPLGPIILLIIFLFPRCGCAVLCTYFCHFVWAQMGQAGAALCKEGGNLDLVLIHAVMHWVRNTE